MSSTLQTDLKRLNLLSAGEAEHAFLKCCGSKNWARLMTAARPFESTERLSLTADQMWLALEPADWLEAFHSHPKIGEQKAAAKTTVEAQQWSADEQSGIRNSARQTMDELAELNREYEEKFGYIFIVCASGKSSEEMLRILRQRLKNEPEVELRIAAAEQAEITQLRLRKLIASRE